MTLCLVRSTANLPAAAEPPVTMDMRMDFFDFGTQPQVRMPDPDRVVEGPLEDAPSSSSIA